MCGGALRREGADVGAFASIEIPFAVGIKKAAGTVPEFLDFAPAAYIGVGCIVVVWHTPSPRVKF